MAIKLPKLPNFGTADAKSRVFLIFAGLVGFCIFAYILIKTFSGSGETAGPSRIANPAANVQSVPGSKLTPEYYQALRQANLQATQQASMSGGSAVPTLVNVPGQNAGNCTVLCPSDDNVDVLNDINDLVKQGKISQDDADKLAALAKKDVSVDEYAAALDELVRSGKLTPDQARKLLENYKRQHSNAMVADSARAMDAMIKAGQLPLDVANDLLAFQKTHPTAGQYAAELDRLVKQGKITPATAGMLLGQYSQQQQNERSKVGAYQLTQMTKAGEVTPSVAARLADLQSRNVPVDEYAAELQKLIAAGKLTPEASAKLLAQYKTQRAGTAATAALEALLKQREAACTNEVSDAVKLKKLSPEIGDSINSLRQQNVPMEQFQSTIAALVKEGKITQTDGSKFIACYKGLTALRNQLQKLKDLQLNNASIGTYADELKQAVVAGLISPDVAARLLQDYQVSITPVSGPSTTTSLPGAEDFERLQQQLAQQQVAAPAEGNSEQFAAAQAQASAEALQARQQRIQEIEAAMTTQAQQLLTSWQQSTPMQHKEAPKEDKSKNQASGEAGKNKIDPSSKSQQPSGPPLIKAGTILFAVLDTAVNSDYPDTPVLATIVSGEYKGAKLLGKVQVGQGRNLDKVSLTFNLMDMPNWNDTKPITAFAVDPDTARTVMASAVDRHYLDRYGAIMASSFLSGYASAITQAGSTATTGVFGTTTTFPALSPASKFAIGLGKVGTTISDQVAKNIDIPITVTVNAGVGLGILFMANVTQ